MAQNLPPRERDLALLVADLRQVATDLWRELQETKAAVPTAVDCTTLAREVAYEIGVAVLRARRAERAAVVAREEAEAYRREADESRARYADEVDLVAYWSGVHAAVAAAAVPLSPSELAADILARAGRAMSFDPANPAPGGDRT